MNKVFIVIGESGDYSDHTQWGVCACVNEKRADEIADLLQRMTKAYGVIKGRVDIECIVSYDKEHPRPVEPKRTSETHALVQSVNTGKASNEEKAQYRIAMREESAHLKEYSEVYDRWATEREAIRKKWLEDNLDCKEEMERAKALDDNFEGGYCVSYGVYELPVVE